MGYKKFLCEKRGIWTIVHLLQKMLSKKAIYTWAKFSWFCTKEINFLWFITYPKIAEFLIELHALYYPYKL